MLELLTTPETQPAFQFWRTHPDPGSLTAEEIVQQAIESIPSGPIQAKVPKIIKVPKGETYVRSENPKGEMGYYLVSDGTAKPVRWRIRPPSFINLSVLPKLCEGALLSDVIAINASIDIVMGEVDR